MANKIYTVMKDGEILKELKTLAAAKRLADAEDAEVFDGTLCVYAPDPVIEDIDLEELEETAALPVIETVTSDKYRLTHRMNVRTAPSKEADKVGVMPSGSEVSVLSIEGDWMHLADDTFILYGGGKYAEKAE